MQKIPRFYDYHRYSSNIKAVVTVCLSSLSFFSNRDLYKKPNSVNSEDADNMNYNAMIDNVGFLFNKVIKVMLNLISGQ